ncbi:MAG TPA: class I SAM-dependent methyltransferase [Candidatus Saccharimonadales bacterium]|nr:class I SAM-dependent methyltransferase [Candidatus Saccharimonadales bacterium]
MKDYAKINKKWWNKVTDIHAKSQLYDLESFKQGKTSLQPIELQELGDVKGKSLLHLLCHFGMDTLSWAREGAEVTGVDISDDAISFATNLSKELDIPAEFICSDVYDLPKILHKQYDIVFASYGVLIWLSNLDLWSEIINKFLKPGGIFYIIELHPFTNMLSSDFTLANKYFKKGPYLDDSSGTYADWDADIQGDTYIWLHTFSDLINSLIKAGLKLEYIHEFPFTMYDQFPGFMVKNEKGEYTLKNKKLQIPLVFSLKATK